MRKKIKETLTDKALTNRIQDKISKMLNTTTTTLKVNSKMIIQL